MSLLAALFQSVAALGFGAMLLAVLGLARQLGRPERAAWSFALGFGMIGWLVFPLGVHAALGNAPLAALLAAGLPGLWWLRGPAECAAAEESRQTSWTWVLFATLAAVAALDVAVALAPPTDGDSLAYHFTLPRQFLEAGRLLPVPRAVDGAVPLLFQMTYLPVLALGGERAMTFWAMFSGWGALIVLYTVVRHWLSRDWALACTLAFATVPAVVYGAGSGQVEVRMAMLLLVAAAAAGRALTQGWRWAMLAGVAAGFLIGAKYTGLLYATACGLVLLYGRGGLARAAAFAGAALVAGVQWYAWNAVQMGDPLFPMLSPLLNYPRPELWDAAVDAAYRADWKSSELLRAPSLAGFLTYPFEATFGLPGVLDAGRTGLGPLPLLLLPFTVAAAWRGRWAPSCSMLRAMAVVALLSYALWYFIPSSLRVRHLLPLLPLVLVGMMVLASRIKGSIVTLAVAAALVVQTGGAAVFGFGFVKRLAAGETDQAFLERTVSNYALAGWINTYLAEAGLVMHTERQLEYFLKVPHLFYHKATVGMVHVAEGMSVPAYAARLRAAGVTHVVAPNDAGGNNPLSTMLVRMQKQGCVTPMDAFTGTTLGSRTLPGFATSSASFVAFRLEQCP